MNAKKFFYVCAGILLLVIAYSVGAHKAGAQSGGQFAGITSIHAHGSGVEVPLAITTTGDLYARSAAPSQAVTPNGGFACGFQGWGSDCFGADPGWQYMGNVLTGNVAVDQKTWSSVKQGFKK